MQIRRARPEDTDAICDVVRRSILVLCNVDHRNDPLIIKQWLANKIPENVARWVADPTSAFLVATDSGAVLSAGCVKVHGEVVLNYVAPEARFRGVSHAMMRELEDASRAFGNAVSILDSTRTALRFYNGLGYTERAEPTMKHGLTTFPLTRTL